MKQATLSYKYLQISPKPSYSIAHQHAIVIVQFRRLWAMLWIKAGRTLAASGPAWFGSDLSYHSEVTP